MRNIKGRNISNSHLLCLAAAFTIGSTIINLPLEGSGELTTIGLVAAAAISVILVYLLSPLLSFVFSKERRGPAFLPFYIAATITLFFIALSTFKDFCRFASLNMLEETSPLVIAAVFALCCGWGAMARDSAISKFALISFLITLVTLLIFFLFLIPRFDFKYFLPQEKITVMGVLGEIKPYLSGVTLPTLTVLLFGVLNEGRVRKAPCSLGIIGGFFCLALALLSSILLFGGRQAATMDFAYADAISTVSIGYLFTRMDGFAYFVFFAAALIKASVCIILIEKLLERYKINRRGLISSAAAILLFVFNLFS